MEKINLTELGQKLDDLNTQITQLKNDQVEAAETTALTEKVEDKPVDYKVQLATMLRGQNDFTWTGGKSEDSDRKMFEAIGAVTAGSAIPEIWAKDVFRCCPYPASAFWDAPFIKWHEDIHGKPGDTVHVITVGKATCGTAGCAEPVSTAPVVDAEAITLEEYQCSMYICRNDLEDMVADTIVELNNSLASCLDTCIDNAFIANIIGLGSTLDKGTAYLTPAHIAEAIGTMRSGNLYKQKRLWYII